MNTHIIIPIKDIEEEIKGLKGNRSIYGLRKAAYLEKLIKTSKKISLDEKDIDNTILYQTEDGPLEYNNKEYSIYIKGMLKGYTKALKDLI